MRGKDAVAASVDSVLHGSWPVLMGGVDKHRSWAEESPNFGTRARPLQVMHTPQMHLVMAADMAALVALDSVLP